MDDVTAGIITLAQRTGNEAADKWAGVGAHTREVDSSVASILDGMTWLVQSRLLYIYSILYWTIQHRLQIICLKHNSIL